MKKTDAMFISWASFSTWFAIAYSAILYFKIKVPKYFPLDHAWAFDTQPGKIAQGWYGMFGLAFLAALILSLIGYFVLRSGKIKSSTAVEKIVSTVSVAIIAFTMVWFIFHEFVK